MANVTSLASEVMEKIPNKYMAVIVASKRARAINDGKKVLVRSNASKPTTVAMEEIAAGFIVPEARKPKVEVIEEEKELLTSPDEEAIPETELVHEDEDEDEDNEDE